MILKRIFAAYALILAFIAALVLLPAWLLSTPLMLTVLDKPFGQENCLGQFVQELAVVGQLSLLFAVVFLSVAAMIRQEDVSSPPGSYRRDRFHPDFDHENQDFPPSFRRPHAHQPPGTLLRSSSRKPDEESADLERWENEGGKVC